MWRHITQTLVKMGEKNVKGSDNYQKANTLGHPNDALFMTIQNASNNKVSSLILVILVNSIIGSTLFPNIPIRLCDGIKFCKLINSHTHKSYNMIHKRGTISTKFLTIIFDLILDYMQFY